MLTIGLVVVLAATGQGAIATTKGVDTALCGSHQHDPTRVSVPANFLFDACFEGDHLYLKNPTQYVLHVIPSGDTGTLMRARAVVPSPASLIIEARLSDPRVLPPGYALSVAVGPGASSISIEDSGLNSWFIIMRFLISAIPLGDFDDLAEAYSALGALSDSLEKESAAARQCLATNNVVGDAVCIARLIQHVKETIERQLATKLAKAMLKVLAKNVSKFFGPFLELLEINEAATGPHNDIAGSVVRLDISAKPKQPDATVRAGVTTTRPTTTTQRPATTTTTTLRVTTTNRLSPPAAPGNLSAAPVGTDQMLVGWSDNSDNEDRFVVSTRNGVVGQIGADADSILLGGLAPGTSACYRVRAENQAGASAWSDEACAATDQDLGGLDLYAFCESIGFNRNAIRERPRLGPGAAYNNWFCEDGPDALFEIDFLEACEWQYGRPDVYALPTDPNDANSWRCYAPTGVSA